MNKNEKKNDYTRNDINSGINEFGSRNNPYSMNFEKLNEEINKNPNLDIINNVVKQNNYSSSNYDYNRTNLEKKNNSFDNKVFKNQINNRICNLSNSQINLKKLPMNNNIRDYNVHIESTKDEFNDKLLNYSLLASSIQSQPAEDNKIFNMGFHSKFKEDNNERFDQFSPLSCNIGFPIRKSDKTPDFGQNLEPSGYSNFGNYQNIQNNEYGVDINKDRELRYERQMPVNTTQHFNFKNVNQDI